MKEFINNTITFNARGFIVPNGLCAPEEFCIDVNERAEFAARLLKEAGIPCADPKKELMVDIWYVSQEDLDCDNISDHGFTAMYEGKEVYCRAGTINYLPVRLFLGHKEGDTINLKLPVHIRYADQDSFIDTDGIMDMNLTLDQAHYRYRNYGAFHEVLQKLVEVMPGDSARIPTIDGWATMAEVLTRPVTGVSAAPATAASDAQ